MLFAISDIDKGTFFYTCRRKVENFSCVKRVAKSYRRVGRVILVYSANIYSCSKFSRFKAEVTFPRLVI